MFADIALDCLCPTRSRLASYQHHTSRHQAALFQLPQHSKLSVLFTSLSVRLLRLGKPASNLAVLFFLSPVLGSIALLGFTGDSNNEAGCRYLYWLAKPNHGSWCMPVFNFSFRPSYVWF